jgi:2-oxoglutarate dehydrogenase E1 component
VVNCTTPANYFHALRRQAHEPRRPLVMFTPKSLLRRREVVSTLAEMGPGTAFRPVIGPDAGNAALRRLVLCSGKIYWDLAEERGRCGLPDVGVVRLEQLYPFPEAALENVLRAHPYSEVVWAQEEPRNMGPWSHVDRRVEAVLRRIGHAAPWPNYVGRPENPSPAIGTTAEHNADQARIVAQALGVAGNDGGSVPG